MGKRLIGEREIQQAAREGQRTLNVPPAECIVTPMARDAAAALGIDLVADIAAFPAGGAESPAPGPEPAGAPGDAARLVAQVVSRLQARIPAGVSAERLGQVVRDVVASRLAAASASSVAKAGQAVRLIARAQNTTQVDVDGALKMEEVLPAAQGGGLAAGILAWEKAAFDRKVDADEIDIVISGQLEVTVEGQSLQAGPGDMVYLSQGAKVVYRTPSSVTLACVNRV